MALDPVALATKVLATVQNAGGRTIVFTLQTAVYDPVTGKLGESDPVTHTVTSSPIFPQSGREFRAGDNAAREAAVVYVPAKNLQFLPAAGQKVTAGTQHYTVVSVKEFGAVTTPIVYEVGLARGAHP